MLFDLGIEIIRTSYKTLTKQGLVEPTTSLSTVQVNWDDEAVVKLVLGSCGIALISALECFSGGIALTSALECWES